MPDTEAEQIRARINEALGGKREVVLERHDHRPDGTYDHYVFALSNDPKIWTSLTITAEDLKTRSREQVLDSRVKAAIHSLKSRMGIA